MSKKLRISTLFLVLILILSLAAGCSKRESSNDGVVSGPEYPQEMPAESPGAPSMPAPAPLPEKPVEESKDGDYGLAPGWDGSIEPDKIITTVYLSAETTEFDKSLETLYTLIKENGGYLSSSNIYFGNYYDGKGYRTGDFSIRIPRDKVNQFKAQIPGIGSVTAESTSKEDVTQYYRDTESRLNVLEIKEERLLALLEKAERIEDIIAIENSLSEVIFEKENLKATLINMDDRIDYSTFNVSLREVAKVTTTETVETTFIDRVQTAFDNSLYNFVKSAENLAIFLIFNGPILIVLLVGLLIILWILKRLFRKIFPKRSKIVAPKAPEPIKEEPRDPTKE